MKGFYNLKISAKLLIGFVIVALIAGAVGGYGMINISALDKNDKHLYESITAPLGEMIFVADAFQRARGNVRDILLSRTPEEFADYEKRIGDRLDEVDQHIKVFQETLITEEGKQQTSEIIQDVAQYREVAKQIVQYAKEGRFEEGRTLAAGKGNDLRTNIEKNYRALTETKVALGKDTADGNTAQANQTMMTMGILVAVAMILAIGLGLFLSRIISKPLIKGVEMMQEMSKGHLTMRMNMVTKDEVGVMGQAMDSFADDLQTNVIGVLNKIAVGDVSANVIAKDERDEISPAMAKTIEIIRALIADVNKLIVATQEGKLDTRGNASVYDGSWKELVQGLNSLIDAFVAPINVTAEYVERISRGDIPQPIEDVYYGDFNEIKNSINLLINTLNSFIGDMKNMAEQHDLGDIDVVVPAEKFDGAYKVMAQGVNGMVNGHISVKKKAMACLNQFAIGNFDAELEKFPGKKAFINENIEAMRKNLKNVNSEIGSLVTAAIEGQLKARAQEDMFHGDWRTLIQGLNKLLEAVIEPINEAAVVLQDMAQGSLQKRVTGNYKGDHAAIKNAMNETLDALSGYVTEISDVLNEMANSNLQVGINNEYKGDFAQIKDALNLIIESLNTVLGDINNASEQVAAGSRQVSDGSQALSQGATEQAASVEELTASITQVSAQTKQNAQNANQANELAIVAKDNAEQGNNYMQGMLKSMTDINESSNNISKIIKVIDEIAFQTNILALNAAVEAARAGQHGKGFAVVAEEVRNLAARSANAAKETTAMIEGSIKKVEDGTKIANETAGALEKIVDGVAKAADLVKDIAVASNEQATGIAQINKGIEQVSQVVQTNSATAEQSAAASEELSSQAELLKEMVGGFRLKRNSGHKNREEASGRTEKPQREKRAEIKKPRISLSDSDFGKY